MFRIVTHRVRLSSRTRFRLDPNGFVYKSVIIFQNSTSKQNSTSNSYRTLGVAIKQLVSAGMKFVNVRPSQMLLTFHQKTTYYSNVLLLTALTVVKYIYWISDLFMVRPLYQKTIRPSRNFLLWSITYR